MTTSNSSKVNPRFPDGRLFRLCLLIAVSSRKSLERASLNSPASELSSLFRRPVFVFLRFLRLTRPNGEALSHTTSPFVWLGSNIFATSPIRVHRKHAGSDITGWMPAPQWGRHPACHSNHDTPRLLLLPERVNSFHLLRGIPPVISAPPVTQSAP